MHMGTILCNVDAYKYCSVQAPIETDLSVQV